PTAGSEDVTSFNVKVTADDGTTTSDGTLVVNIEDDSPTAADDSNSVDEDGAAITGSVLTNDHAGGDGFASPDTAVTAIDAGAVGQPIDLTYGTLTLKGDGSYEYQVDHSKVQGLDSGETRTEEVTYTITDADGDTAQATLTITINGTNDAPVVGRA